MKVAQSCPTLCDPIDSSPPGSPVPGILQARILEWVAISVSRMPPNQLRQLSTMQALEDLGLTPLLNKEKDVGLKKRILKRGIFNLSIFFPCSPPSKSKESKNKESSGKIRPMSGSWWLEERTLLLESPPHPSSATLQGPESPSSVFLLLICKASPSVPLYTCVKQHRGKPFYLKLVTLSFSFLN